MEKRLLRKQIESVKKSFTNEQLRKLSHPIINRVMNHPKFMSSKYILIYHSLPDEVYTHDFIEFCSVCKTVLLPIVKGDILQIRKYTNYDNTCIGHFGIVEPGGSEFTEYSKIDLAIVPGIAFDNKCNRIGRGKGYYDKLLANINCYKIGICFPFQIVHTIPTDEHDIKMDEVIS